MIHTDRDRLFLAVGVALVFHGALFGGFAIAGFDFTPYPETSPVTVTLPDYRPPEVEPEPEPEPVPVEPEPVEPEPDPAEIAPAEAAPDEPEPRPAEPEPAPPARDTGPVPAPPSAASPSAPPATGSDAPPGAFSQDDLRWQRDDTAAAREGDRTSDEDIFASRSPTRRTPICRPGSSRASSRAGLKTASSRVSSRRSTRCARPCLVSPTASRSSWRRSRIRE